MLRLAALLFLSLLVPVLGGCGGDAYPKAVVTGRVMCGDKPAWGGVITFQPVDAPEKTGNPPGNPGGVSRATVEEDGTFRLTYEARGASPEDDGAVIGPHRVVFIPPVTEPPKWESRFNELPEEDQAQIKAELAKQKVYPKLECGIELTPNEVEVKPGENNFDFTLQAGAATAPRQFTPPTGSD